MLAQTGKRLTTRITDHVQEKLQTAADLVGATLNQFVVQAALEPSPVWYGLVHCGGLKRYGYR